MKDVEPLKMSDSMARAVFEDDIVPIINVCQQTPLWQTSNRHGGTPYMTGGRVRSRRME